MQTAIQAAVSRLRRGLPPGDETLIEELSAGVSFITNFWQEKYLGEYISAGGSKIKFLTGDRGSGKSHCLELFSRQAARKGFVTARLSAKQTWVHDIKEIYFAVLEQVNLPRLLQQCADNIIAELGYDPADIPGGMNFADHLSAQGKADPITKREIRSLLHENFTQNGSIDNNFALCCALLTGGLLGYPVLEEQSRLFLEMWLSGSKELKLTQLKKLGLSPARITKFNARHMLRSLVEVVKSAGHPGLLVCIDDLDALLSASGLDELRYTKMKREDTYESIRELIDEIDSLSNIMFVFAFDRALMEDEGKGFKSYQALWMRVQSEITGKRFNRFADIIDLDKLARQEYSPAILTEMSRRLSEVLARAEGSAIPVDEQRAQALLSDVQYGTGSLPLKVNRLTLGGESDD